MEIFMVLIYIPLVSSESEHLKCLYILIIFYCPAALFDHFSVLENSTYFYEPDILKILTLNLSLAASNFSVYLLLIFMYLTKSNLILSFKGKFSIAIQYSLHFLDNLLHSPSV